MRLCIVGDPEDLTAAYVAWLARERGASTLVLPEEGLGLEWSFRLGDHGDDAIDLDGEEIPLGDVDGAFVRLNPQPTVRDDLGVPEAAEPIYAVERRYGLHWLLDNAPFPVVNRPRAGRSNASKPWQMRELSTAGLRVPRWIVTNDEAEAREFVGACPHGAIYKSCSGLRSRVRRADVGLFDRLAAGSAPVLLQSYVPGQDARVHVVGADTFATEIHSTALDYRFDGVPTEYRPVDCPAEVASLCHEQAAESGLLLAGIDFRVTAEGHWWCLEMNPVPTFLPYEAATGHPIGDRILDLLVPGLESPFSESPLRELFGRPAPEGADR